MIPNVVDSKLEQRWLLMRFFVATVLLVAAGLKAHQLSTVPMLGDGIFHSRWLNVLVVEFELFFGLWLVFGFLPKLTRLAAMGCFLAFAIVSFYEALSGETSCGCFGAVVVNPWFTMTFDCSIVILLWRFFPKINSSDRTDKSKIFSFVVSWLVISVSLTWGMLTYKPAFLTTDGKIIGDSQAVILYPHEWIDKKFPLLEYVDVPKDISSGKWVLILYRADCTKCEKHFVRLREQDDFQNNSDVNFACLEIDGLSQNSLRYRFDNGKWNWGSLKSMKRWFVETPTILEIEDGNVKTVITE
jgi:uncharacterized membrane protein YphA (DoxX/SURF4 family)